ncbi:MAG: DinB family protein [Chitinophagaceae bacterium]|nr:MAG: DinB family protein [Chitinophagaceae bacterium]
MHTPIHGIIEEIREALTGAFSRIDAWFDRPESERRYKPAGGWSIDAVLEHVALTNHFLLILVDKGGRKALEAAQKTQLSEALADYRFHRDALLEVGRHGAFEWIRPEHMEPKGKKPAEVRAELHEQLERSLAWLERLPNGEGALHKTTMSVNALGKIDVYEYLYFIAQHARRHETQLGRIASEYQKRAHQ